MKTTTMKEMQLPEEGFVRINQVLNVLGIAKTTLYEGIEAGIFPAPKKLTKRTSVWSVRELREFIEKVEREGSYAPL